MSQSSTTNTLLWHKSAANEKWECYWSTLCDSQIKLFNKDMEDLELDSVPIKNIPITSTTQLFIKSDNIINVAILYIKNFIKWNQRWCTLSRYGYMQYIDFELQNNVRIVDISCSKFTFNETDRILTIKNKNEWYQLQFELSKTHRIWSKKMTKLQKTALNARDEQKYETAEPTLFVFTIKNGDKTDYFCVDNVSNHEQWTKQINIAISKNIPSAIQLKFPLDDKEFQDKYLSDIEKQKIKIFIDLISNKYNYVNINYSFLARYIIHAKFKYEKAIRRFLNFKEIEKEYKLNSIKLEQIAFELQKQCYIVCGHDLQNRPIICLRINKFDKNTDISIIIKSLIVLMDAIASDLWVIKNGICLIFDLTDIDSNKNISLLDLEKIFIKAFQDGYPIMVKKFIIVNASFIPKTAISIAKLVLQKKLAERIESVQSEYPNGGLWGFVDIQQLPSFLNGKYDFFAKSQPNNAWEFVTTKLIGIGNKNIDQKTENDIDDVEEKKNDNNDSEETKTDQEIELIIKWLSEEVQLPQYIDLFIKHGIDCIDVLKEIEIEDLNKIGIVIGHSKRIALHINKLKHNQIDSNNQLYKDEGICNNNDSKLQQIINMGFDEKMTVNALNECHNDLNQAIQYLLDNSCQNNNDDDDELHTPYI